MVPLFILMLIPKKVMNLPPPHSPFVPLSSPADGTSRDLLLEIGLVKKGEGKKKVVGQEGGEER